MKRKKIANFIKKLQKEDKMLFERYNKTADPRKTAKILLDIMQKKNYSKELKKAAEKKIIQLTKSSKGIYRGSWQLYYYQRNLFNFLNEINKLLKHKKKVKVLDVGCGKGIAMKELINLLKEKKLNKKVTIIGMDRAKIYPKPLPNFIQGNILSHSFKQKFDLITSHQVLQYNRQKIRIIKKLFDLLNPKGKLNLHLDQSSIKFKYKGKAITPKKAFDLILGRKKIEFKYDNGQLIIKKNNEKQKIDSPIKLIKTKEKSGIISNVYEII